MRGAKWVCTQNHPSFTFFAGASFRAWSNGQMNKKLLIVRFELIREEIANIKLVSNFWWGWGATMVSSLGLHLLNNITWFGPIGLTSCDGDVQTRALNRPLGVSINKQQALVMKWFWARQCGINWGLKYSLFRDDTRDGWGSLFPGAHDKKKILILRVRAKNIWGRARVAQKVYKWT